MSRLVERVADLQYKGFDLMRHRRAAEAAREPAAAADFESLRDFRQCLVVSFKRSGEPVATPVNFGLSEDGRLLYFRSEPRSAKVRRIGRDPLVRICACNIRGKPKGPMIDARARVVSPSESQDATAAVESNWSFAMKPIERGLDLLPLEIGYVEVTPALPEATGEGQ